jgi:replicative DNA helicase
MRQSIEDILAEENFLHYAYHLRGVINEVLELLDQKGFEVMSDRLERATVDFADALKEWAERLPDVEMEEVDETP